MFRTFRALAVCLLAALGLVAAAPEAQAQSTITKAQREVLIFQVDLSQGDAAQRAFYDFVEFSAVSLAQLNFGPNYNRVHTVSGAQATRARLTSKLREIAQVSTVRAVDLVFVTHGLSGEVSFSDQRVSMTSVRNDILAGLTAAQRAKLRMVFSTACYGESHRARWIGAGFKVVSGSRAIYADSATSYLPFLLSWANGGTFVQAVTAANLADPLRLQDAAAKPILFMAGFANWNDVDSFRLVTAVSAAATNLRINTML